MVILFGLIILYYFHLEACSLVQGEGKGMNQKERGGEELRGVEEFIFNKIIIMSSFTQISLPCLHNKM